MLAVLESWLKAREEYVVIAGAQSSRMTLRDMVYQGTVWGPTLWNSHFGDAIAIMSSGVFTVIVYADNINAFKSFPRSISNYLILEEL